MMKRTVVALLAAASLALAVAVPTLAQAKRRDTAVVLLTVEA